MSSTMELRSTADRLIELYEAGETEAVLDLAEELAQRALGWEQPDEIVRESLFIARFQRALALIECQELQAAEAAFAEAASTPTDFADPDQRHEIAMAMLHQGMCRDALDDPQGAGALYEEISARFGDADDPVTRGQVIRARVNLAVARLNAGDVTRALENAQRLKEELSPLSLLEADQWVMACRTAAAAFEANGSAADAVEVLGEVDHVTFDEAEVQEQLMHAHLDRARLLEELGDHDGAEQARSSAEAAGSK